jgi:hypothetical protein
LRRLGVKSRSLSDDTRLASAWVKFLIASQAPFEQAFFDWHGGLASQTRASQSPSASFYAGADFEPVFAALADFESVAKLDHPYFARSQPCTMLIDEVEAIWAPIAEHDDWGLFHAKLHEIGEMREAYNQKPA